MSDERCTECALPVGDAIVRGAHGEPYCSRLCRRDFQDAIDAERREAERELSEAEAWDRA